MCTPTPPVATSATTWTPSTPPHAMSSPPSHSWKWRKRKPSRARERWPRPDVPQKPASPVIKACSARRKAISRQCWQRRPRRVRPKNGRRSATSRWPRHHRRPSPSVSIHRRARTPTPCARSWPLAAIALIRESITVGTARSTRSGKASFSARTTVAGRAEHSSAIASSMDRRQDSWSTPPRTSFHW